MMRLVPTPARTPSILVVEDDVAMREIVAEALASAGYAVRQAVDGLDALAKIESATPDLIVSDVDMPRMTGLELKRALNDRVALRNIPFVFLSGLTQHEDIRRGMRAAADDYLLKPVHLAELLEAVELRLEKHRRHEADLRRGVDELLEGLQLIFPHELTSPITVVAGATDILRDLVETAPDDGIHSELIGIMESATQRIRRLADLYQSAVRANLASFEAGGDPLRTRHPYDLSLLVRARAYETAAVHRATGRLSIDVEAAECDLLGPFVERIVGELVDNAFKFSAHDATVEVSGVRTAEHYRLSVLDRGRGMTPDEIASVGLFRQFNRERHEQQGLGLGLAVSGRLAFLLGGALELFGRDGGGLEARVTLPMDPAGPPA